jgi:hypothetical protein
MCVTLPFAFRWSFGAIWGAEMVGNGCESPIVGPPDLQATSKAFKGLGLPFVILNALLLVPFFIYKGHPFGFGACDAFANGYLLWGLGFPSTFLLYFCPDAGREHPVMCVSAYVVNFVIVSYFLGTTVSWILRKLLGVSCDK